MEKNKIFYSKIQLLISLLYNGYLKDIRLFKAFLDVQIKDFIPKDILPQVKIYNDAPVLFYFEKERPESLRTISAPHMISIMIQNLILDQHDDLLILGAKSGYLAALAHKLAPNGKIVILEANSRIAKITLENLKHLDLQDEIKVIVKNPLEGMPEMSPWKKILVTGAIKQEKIYTLLQQLDKDNGVLFAPIGEDFIQVYTQIIRINDDFYGKKHLSVRFTPLITQVELDELKLISNIDEINSYNKAPPKKILENYEKNISIKYTTDILEEIKLKPYSNIPKYDIKPKSIFLAFLETMDNTINILRSEEDLNQWINFIENFEILIDIFKRYTTGIKINIKKIELALNQIKVYNLIREEIKHDKVSSTDILLDKKIDILKKQIGELNNLQQVIKKEINKISKP